MHADSMIGRKRMENLRFCVESVLDNNVKGDFIETGVWRGGACIYMRAILSVRGVTDRDVWLADSFEGLPKPDGKYPADANDKHWTRAHLRVSLEDVQENFKKYGLLDQQVRFLKGWFKDTLPTAPIQRLAILRLDGDLYSSTIEALNALYDRVSPGGYIIVDDYVLPTARLATNDFRKDRGISESLHDIDGMGAYWQKAL
jgi:O-methyltransferase